MRSTPEHSGRRGSPSSFCWPATPGAVTRELTYESKKWCGQFRYLFGDEHLDLSLLTIDRSASGRYFRTVKQLEVPDFYPKYLFDVIHEQHGVIACEGSMFKSKFANALKHDDGWFALGLASAGGKTCGWLRR